jgi:signal transduction histidine kinase
LANVIAESDDRCAALLATLCEQGEISSQARDVLASAVEHVRAAAIADERERVAREVHDSIAQAFIGINMLLSAVPGAASEVVKKARCLALHGLQESRRAIHALLPAPLMSRPFGEAVRRMASIAVPPQMRLEVESTGDWSALPPESACELFRMVQEAVNNAIKHSRAARLRIDLSCTDREAVALIDDDGRGFNVSGCHDAGFGLVSMRQRAACSGGRVDIVSSPDRGTQVFISIAFKRVQAPSTA